MNKNESKYFNTALRMDDALIALLGVKDLEYITVKDVCEKAGVNRSTFYLHYETIGDLLNETVERVQKRFIDSFPQDEENIMGNISEKKPDELVLLTPEYLLPYLRYIRENKKVYLATFRNPNTMRANIKYASFKRNIFEPILEKFGIPEIYRKYYIVYYIDGIMAIIHEWLDNDCHEPIEVISKIIEDCVGLPNLPQKTEIPG